MLRLLKVLVLLAGLMLSTGHAFAQIASGDPCEVFPKSSASISITSATTTSIIAPVTGQAIYVCGVNIVAAAATTYQIEYGTGATCGTGTTAMTGVIPPSTVVTPTQNSTQLVTPVTQRLCILSTGTAGIHGYLNYVQN